MFAANPRQTAAYPENKPISGCLPTPRYTSAANGGNNIVPASEAILQAYL